ncbi:MAG: 3-oxoacyl-[acyl-carrier-protein] synthase III C-terminal domain-containing protein [Planctomycetota bacterium]
MNCIIATSHVQGEYVYDQSTVKQRILQWLNGSSSRLQGLADSFDRAIVSSRSSVVPIEWVFSERGIQESNDVYKTKAAELATRATEECLARAGLEPRDVDYVISTSCTGFMIPSVEAVVAERLGMRPDLRRLPITEHGCAAGVVGLTTAADYLVAHPQHKVLVLSVELPSVTFQPGDLREANIISSALFGDGAAAALLAGEAHSGCPRIVAQRSARFANGLDLMGFDLRDSGLHIVLSRKIPAVLQKEVPGLLHSFLAEHGLSLQDINHYLFHPGGRRIIEAFEETMQLPQGALDVTRSVLQRYGNLSSATVLVVLGEYLERGLARPGEIGLMVAFGPGFGAEMALVEW